MPYYNCGDYVYFISIIDSPKEHHNQFILDEEPDLYYIDIKFDGWDIEIAA